jgi:hypothetical protein
VALNDDGQAPDREFGPESIRKRADLSTLGVDHGRVEEDQIFYLCNNANQAPNPVT